MPLRTWWTSGATAAATAAVTRKSLSRLVDIINDPSVGICIDTGHAHLSGSCGFLHPHGRPPPAVHAYKRQQPRRRHAPAPFMGSIDWADTMRALADIGYTGDFSLELGSHRYPDLTRATWCRFVHDLGEDLLQWPTGMFKGEDMQQLPRGYYAVQSDFENAPATVLLSGV